MVVKETFADRVFNGVNIVVMCLVLLIMLYPLYFVVIASFSNPDLVNTGKVLFYPREITFDGYNMVYNYKAVWTGYRNSLFYAVTSTLYSLTITMCAAYAMSRHNLKFKNFFTAMFMFPMFFTGGLIPTYILYTSTFGWYNTIWPLILPGATSLMSIVICRTFINSTIHEELFESAQIDGASHFRIFFTIVLPLSTAIIAVQALMNVVGSWNSFFNALLYISDSPGHDQLIPLQLVLRKILVVAQNRAVAEEFMGSEQSDTLKYQRIVEQIKYALIIVSVIPVLLFYPFIQKYFVKGVMIGAIKG